MPLNNFCVNNYVDYRNLIKDYNNSKLPFENIYDTNICECSNNLYITQSGKPIEFYCRKVKELDCEYGRQLVYTCSNKLISGFGKEVIY
jgi:hypothetical protein